jgi:hypothetical protein
MSPSSVWKLLLTVFFIDYSIIFYTSHFLLLVDHITYSRTHLLVLIIFLVSVFESWGFKCITNIGKTCMLILVVIEKNCIYHLCFRPKSLMYSKINSTISNDFWGFDIKFYILKVLYWPREKLCLFEFLPKKTFLECKKQPLKHWLHYALTS